MKVKIIFNGLLLVGISITAQIKGVVKDSITGKPIPYVSIWVENENYGTTSEENGEFSIRTSDKTKKLVFSILGFEQKTVVISKVSDVILKPIAYQLDEIRISNRIGKKQREIGKTDNVISEAFDNGPKIDVKFFPYLSSYKRTKYIKQVSLFTDSRIENATVRIHFYTVDSDGKPGEEMLDKDFIALVSKGITKMLFDVTKFNLSFPKKGLFVGFEKMNIAKNRIDNSTINNAPKYAPFALYNRVERGFSVAFLGGKWIKTTKQDSDSSGKMTIYEPAITLILTN